MTSCHTLLLNGEGASTHMQVLTWKLICYLDLIPEEMIVLLQVLMQPELESESKSDSSAHKPKLSHKPYISWIESWTWVQQHWFTSTISWQLCSWVIWPKSDPSLFYKTHHKHVTAELKHMSSFPFRGTKTERERERPLQSSLLHLFIIKPHSSLLFLIMKQLSLHTMKRAGWEHLQNKEKRQKWDHGSGGQGQL